MSAAGCSTVALISPALIDAMASGLPSKPTTITLPSPAAFSAAIAPSAIVSLPAITPLMLRLPWMSVSIFWNASRWSQLALCRPTILRPGYLSMTSWNPRLRTRGVGVGLPADELDVAAALPHQPHELLGRQRGALVVVRDDLRRGDAGGVDLAVDQDARNAGCLRLRSPPQSTRRRRRCRG